MGLIFVERDHGTLLFLDSDQSSDYQFTLSEGQRNDLRIHTHHN